MSKDLPTFLEPGGIEVVTAAGGARRYRKPLTSFRPQDIVSIFAASLGEWSRHKAPRLGASLAFYTLLSIAPLLLVLVSVVGLVLGNQPAQLAIISQVQAVAGRQGAAAARALLEGSGNTAHGIIATAFGVLTLLLSASGLLIELRDALNTIWEVSTPELRGLKMLSSFIKERLLSFVLLLAVGFIVVVSLTASALLAALGSWTASILPAHDTVLEFLNFVVSFVMITGLFSAIYRFFPDVRIEWRDVVLGAAITAGLFTMGKLVLGIYLGKPASHPHTELRPQS